MATTSPFFRGSILAELVSRTLFVGIVILFVYGGFAYYVSKKTFDHEMGDRLMAIARLSAGQTRLNGFRFWQVRVIFTPSSTTSSSLRKKKVRQKIFSFWILMAGF